MGTVADVLAVAQRNIGFIEGPNNKNPYAPLVGHANNQPWCASFVAAVFKRAGVPLPNTSAYTPTMAGGFKVAGLWHTDFGKPGDVVFFHWPAMGRIAHVGIVESADPGTGTYTTIEGNTDIKGGRTGGRVMRTVRRANIAGFGRPLYAPAEKTLVTKTKPKPALVSPLLGLGSGGKGAGLPEQRKVKDIQRALLKLGYAPKGVADRTWVDGDFGEGTKKALLAFQRKEKLSRTGKTDADTWARLRQRVHG